MVLVKTQKLTRPDKGACFFLDVGKGLSSGLTDRQESSRYSFGEDESSLA